MGSSLRYWTNPKAVIDLADVVAIVETGWGGIAGYSYEVAIKKVGTLELKGTGLITQWKKYKEVEDGEQDEGDGAASI